MSIPNPPKHFPPPCMVEKFPDELTEEALYNDKVPPTPPQPIVQALDDEDTRSKTFQVQRQAADAKPIHLSGGAYVAVSRSANIPGNLIYILVDDKSVFDAIDLPESLHAHEKSVGENNAVRSKSIEKEQDMIIFQFWFKS